MKYRLRWRDDATGYVAKYAGLWAQRLEDAYPTLADAEEARKRMPNGGQIEIHEVEA